MTQQATCQQFVRDVSGTTTFCDRPLPDTARVCPTCVRRMQATLARCINLWRHVEALVGRSLNLGGVAGTGTRTGAPRVLVGPWCRPACEHPSCMAVTSQVGRLRNEAPIPNEEALLLNVDALEDQWAVGNTLTTWARLLSEETGVPIPAEREWVGHDAPLAAPLTAEARCEFSDLPTRPHLQCACNHPRRSHR